MIWQSQGLGPVLGLAVLVFALRRENRKDHAMSTPHLSVGPCVLTIRVFWEAALPGCRQWPGNGGWHMG